MRQAIISACDSATGEKVVCDSATEKKVACDGDLREILHGFHPGIHTSIMLLSNSPPPYIK